ncbi:UNVERIFIED_CONTAM: hypothetical protein PYX00_000157 [Menopon gallinae]
MLPQTRLFLSLFKRNYSDTAHEIQKISEKPLKGLFFHPQIQLFIKKITFVDYEKVFKSQEKNTLRPPVYQFMSDDELQANKAKGDAKIASRLQAPPIVDLLEDNTEILSNDPSLDGHDVHHSKIVFTDLSLNVLPTERTIVVREPNGVLRTANKLERRRLLQIYFPIKGRELQVPKMFKTTHLNDLLKRKEYEFILNRACVQFDPTDEEFHRVLILTYNKINIENDFERIDSTRHFGSLGFYLAINRNINNMLQYFLDKQRLMSAYYLVKMYHLVNSNASISWDVPANEIQEDEKISLDQAFKVVEDYIKSQPDDTSKLQQKFVQMVEKLKEEEDVQSGILKAHGV